jgi:hypothetical protein
MRVDVDHADRSILADGAQQRKADRMIAPDRKRNDIGCDQRRDKGFDILVARREVVAAAQRDVADIGDGEVRERRHAENVLVSSHPLDVADGARTETGAGAIGDAEIHGNAEQGDVDLVSCRNREIGAEGRAQQGRDASVGRRTFVRVFEDGVSDRAEMGIENLVASRIAEFGAQALQFLPIKHRAPSTSRSKPVTSSG